MKVFICVLITLCLVNPVSAAKLHTFHISNEPVIFYIVDTLGRHRNRVIVYPNEQKKGFVSNIFIRKT